MLIVNVSIKYKLLLLTTLIIFLAALIFGASNYWLQKRALLAGIDEKLRAATFLAEQIPPEGYFDRITGPETVPRAEYEHIVEIYNQLCRQLDLQYLWSCMKLDGQIVFTTATSPSKDITEGDHAAFYEVHRDPDAFDVVFGQMRIDYSSFTNEWGDGRMVLVPRLNSQGHPYCLGASIGMGDVNAKLRNVMLHNLLISLLVLVVAVLLSFGVANTLSKPVGRLTAVADRIASGEFGLEIDETGTAELASLSRSISLMSKSICDTVDKLRNEVREREIVQEELRQHRDHLEETVQCRTAELQRSNQDLQQFAYVASHDLQEPLRAIKSFSTLLSRRYSKQLSQEADEFIEYIMDAVTRMKQLINALLDYSRLETAVAKLMTISMEKALADALENLSVTVADSDARVTHEPLPEIRADAGQMTQLFQNLIGNSIKFMAPGTAPLIHISVERHKTGQAWLFAVADNGIGIDMEYAERVFGIFQRLHSRKNFPGTGIGLAACKRIVERHGGSIWFQSEKGKGTSFYFTIADRAGQSTTV